MSSLLLFSGLANGLLYGMMALVFTLLFKVARVPNLAIGGLGTVTAFITLEIYVGAGLPYWAGLTIAFAIGGIFGWVVYEAIFRWLPGDDILVALVATIGLNFILIAVAQRYWAQGEPYDFPGSFDTNTSVLVSGLSPQHALIMVVAVASLGLLYMTLHHTTIGLEIRSVAENIQAAWQLGISTTKVHRLAWIISTAFIGLASVLFAPVLLLDTNILNLLMYKALGAAVLGGLTSLTGAVIGGLILGLVENAVVPFAPTAREAAAFVIIIAILALRPEGLLGKRTLRKI